MPVWSRPALFGRAEAGGVSGVAEEKAWGGGLWWRVMGRFAVESARMLWIRIGFGCFGQGM